MKHTKGPWEINGENEDNGRTRIGSAKDYIGELYHNPDDEANNEENERQTQANAHLIAAAPELLEACKYVVQYHRENDSGEGELFGLDFVTTCIAAIEKAERTL